MINLRYHIVSITAVFLALGIGLTLGSTFLDRVTVDTLKAQLDDVEAQVEHTNEQNAELGQRVGDLEERDAALALALPERLLAGRLTDVPILVLATDGTTPAAVDAAIGALGSAGADVAGTWWITERWLLDDDEEVSDLARLLELRTDDVDRLRRNAAIRLADVLTTATATVDEAVGDEAVGDEAAVDPAAGGGEAAAQDPGAEGDPEPPGEPVEPPAPSEPGLVAALEDTGFVEYRSLPGVESPAVLLPSAEVRYLIVSGTTAPDGPQAFAAALLDELAAEGPVPVLAAQGQADVGSDTEPVAESVRRTTFVGPIREGELTSERISTLDSLDTAAGLAALVLAMEDLATPTIGHYGVAPGASTLLPGPVARS